MSRKHSPAKRSGRRTLTACGALTPSNLTPSYRPLSSAPRRRFLSRKTPLRTLFERLANRPTVPTLGRFVPTGLRLDVFPPPQNRVSVPTSATSEARLYWWERWERPGLEQARNRLEPRLLFPPRRDLGHFWRPADPPRPKAPRRVKAVYFQAKVPRATASSRMIPAGPWAIFQDRSHPGGGAMEREQSGGKERVE